jgi:hypothetical protein
LIEVAAATAIMEASVASFIIVAVSDVWLAEVARFLKCNILLWVI